MTAITEAAILEALARVPEPELGGNLVSRNMVKELVIDGDQVVETQPDQCFLTERYTRRAVDFIDRHRESPFFLYVAQGAAHFPLRAPAADIPKFPRARRPASAPGEMQSESPFMRAMWEIVCGTRHAQHLAESLASEAVARTLQRVCAQHPLDYGTLLAAHQAAVVRECCASFVPEEFAQCQGTTKKGKRCTRRAVVGGVCEKHVKAWREQIGRAHV